MKDVAPSALDPQRDAVYAAEEEWWADYGLAFIESPVVVGLLTPESLTEVSMDLLAKAGWDIGAPQRFVLDVVDDDDDDVAAWHEGATATIHLHPRLIDWSMILHELAHLLDNGRDGHGPRFCGTHLRLVGARFGDLAAPGLLWGYKDYGVNVDERWASQLPT